MVRMILLATMLGKTITIIIMERITANNQR
jgi:hypothetical protein